MRVGLADTQYQQGWPCKLRSRSRIQAMSSKGLRSELNNTQIEYIVEELMQAPARAATNGKATTILSKREEEIARLVAIGLSNREISDKLGLSQHTVKNNLYRVFEKLGISTRLELVLYVLHHAKPSETQEDLAS